MPMAPYVLVLARNSHEGATYARRAKLTRGRYRVVASASSIHGLRRAHVHILPSFDRRPDRHRILAELRWARCEFFTVEMPEPPERPVKATPADPKAFARPFSSPGRIHNPDLAETPVEQLKIDHFFDEIGGDPDRETQDVVELEDLIPEAGGAPGDLVDPHQLDDQIKKRRRTRCKKCGQLHMHDEPCPTGGEVFD